MCTLHSIPLKHSFRTFIASLSIAVLLSASTLTHAQQCFEECNGNGNGGGHEDPPPTTTESSSTRSDSGSHRGAGTTIFLNKLQVVLLNNTDLSLEDIVSYIYGTPWPSSRIDHDPSLLLTPPPQNIKEIICKMQIAINQHQDFMEGREVVAAILGAVFDYSTEAVYAALSNPSFCEGVLEVRRTVTYAMQTKQETPAISLQYFLVDAKGIPVSSDAVWNACIRNTLHYDSTGRPFRCNRGRHHSGSRWYHPDFRNLEFTWNRHRVRPISLPNNIVLVVLDELDLDKLLALAEELYAENIL